MDRSGGERHGAHGWAAACSFAATSFERLGSHPLFRKAPAVGNSEVAAALGRTRLALAAAWAEAMLQQAEEAAAAQQPHPLLQAIDPRADRPLPCGMLGLAAEGMPAARLRALLEPCLSALALRVRELDLRETPSLQRCFASLGVLCSNPALCAAAVAHRCWLGEGAPPSAAGLERGSVLGPFLLPSALPSACAAVGEAAFGDVLHLEPATAEHVQQGLRAQCALLTAQLAAATKALLRADGGRHAVLTYVGAALGASAERCKLRYDPAAACSDALLCNLSVLLLRLTQPVCAGGDGGAPDAAKLRLVSAAFCAPGGNAYLPLLAEGPRLVAAGDPNGAAAVDAAPAAAGSAAEAAGGASFVCSVFWLCAGCLHVGMLPTWRHYARLVADLGRAHKQLRLLRAEASGWPSGLDSPWAPQPAAGGAAGGGRAALVQAQLEACERSVRLLLRAKYCVDVHLLCPEALAHTAAFYAAAALWLNAAIDECDADAAASCALHHVPQWLVEDMAAWLGYVAMHAPSVLLPNQPCAQAIDKVAALAARLIGRADLCASPHTRCALLDALWHCAPVEGNPHLAHARAPPRILERGAALHALLLPAVCALYCAVESTGPIDEYVHAPAAAARHMAHGLLLHALSITDADAAAAGVRPPPAGALGGGGAPGAASGPYARSLAALERAQFVRFGHRLLTDLLLVLSSVAQRTHALAAHEAAAADAAAWAQLPAPERAEREAAARNTAAHLRRDAQLAHGGARCLRAVCRVRASDFAYAAELRSRVPAMLNYAIGLLTGSRLANSRLAGSRLAPRAGGEPSGAEGEPQQCLQPAELLADLLGACVALNGGGGSAPPGPSRAAGASGGGDGVAEAVRGLDPSLLAKAVSLCDGRALLTRAEVGELQALGRSLEAAQSEAAADEEEALAALPDEFICPITATLMDDPVRPRALHPHAPQPALTGPCPACALAWLCRCASRLPK